MQHNQPKSIKDALIAELLGDIGNLYDLVKELDNKAPAMIEKNSIMMRNLLDSWKVEASLKHQDNLAKELPEYKQELRQVIYNEVSGIVSRNFDYHKDVVHNTIHKQFKKFYFYCICIAIVFTLLGIGIGKFLI